MMSSRFRPQGAFEGKAASMTSGGVAGLGCLVIEIKGWHDVFLLPGKEWRWMIPAPEGRSFHVLCQLVVGIIHKGIFPFHPSGVWHARLQVLMGRFACGNREWRHKFGTLERLVVRR